MRKKLFMLVSMLTMATVAVNAQYYVGGSIGFTTSKISSGNSDKSGSSFKVIPEFGYQLNEKVSIGVQAGYSHGYASFGSLTATDIKSALSNMVSIMGDISDEDLKMNSFSIAPYIRYNFVEFGPAKLFVEGSIGYSNIKTDGLPKISSSSSSSSIGSISNKEAKLNAFEIAVRPGISVDISQNLSVITKVGSLGFLTAKESDSDMKITRFGFSVDSYNILLGLNYHF